MLGNRCSSSSSSEQPAAKRRKNHPRSLGLSKKTPNPDHSSLLPVPSKWDPRDKDNNYVCRYCGKPDKNVTKVIDNNEFDWGYRYDSTGTNNPDLNVRRAIVKHSDKNRHNLPWNFARKKTLNSVEDAEDMSRFILQEAANPDSRSAFMYFCRTMNPSTVKCIVRSRGARALQTWQENGCSYMQKSKLNLKEEVHGAFTDVREKLEGHARAMESALESPEASEFFKNMDWEQLWVLLQDVFVANWFQESAIYKPEKQQVKSMSDPSES